MESLLHIQNLKCGGCAHTIKTRLEHLKGISNVVVNNDTHSVSFIHDKEQQLETVMAVLSRLGYPVEGETNPFTKKAQSFVSCAVGKMSKS